MVFSRFGLSPNAWTLLSLVPAIFGFLSLVYGQIIPALVFFMVSGFMDVVDGAVARVTGSASNKGAFLDGVVDRYVEILFYMGLLFFVTSQNIPRFLMSHSYWFVLLVFGALMPTFIRSYADHRDVVTEPEDLRRMGGLIERAERMTLLYIGMVAYLLNPIYLTYLVALTATLTNLTAIQRFIWVLNYRERIAR